jgi:hypothetical protein
MKELFSKKDADHFFKFTKRELWSFVLYSKSPFWLFTSLPKLVSLILFSYWFPHPFSAPLVLRNLTFPSFYEPFLLPFFSLQLLFTNDEHLLYRLLSISRFLSTFISSSFILLLFKLLVLPFQFFSSNTSFMF